MSEEGHPTVSIVAPAFNEEAILPEFYRRMRAVLDATGDSWEIILINDGSRDRSPEIMRELQQWECFQLADSLVGADGDGHDLFAGLR